jgi:DNA ligase D
VAATAGDPVTITVADRELVITNPDKVFFPAVAATKLQLIHYYLDVGDAVMRAMHNRPVLLQRFPNGSSGTSFFQKRMPDNAPEWLSTTIVSTPNGTTSNALVIDDLAHLVWAVNLGCLGFHSWPIRAADPAHCDELRIDLDPGPGTNFAMAQEAAHEVHRLFNELGLRSYIKTTGNRGLHVYVRLLPTWDSVEVRSAAVAVARELARRRSDLITDAWWKEERGERIFIDFNQNAPHKTVFAPWSVRARDHAPVSCGFTWDELDRIVTDDLTIRTVPQRLAQMGDPWADMDDHPQSLEPLLDMVRRDQAVGLMDAPWPPVYPKMAGEPPRVAPSRAKKPKAALATRVDVDGDIDIDMDIDGGETVSG